LVERKDGKSSHPHYGWYLTAIEVKKYLLNAGFTIEKYGILNYSLRG
jgi:hypothetical protein